MKKLKRLNIENIFNKNLRCFKIKKYNEIQLKKQDICLRKKGGVEANVLLFETKTKSQRN